LSENEIEEIDVRLFDSLSNLEYLSLDNNKLKEIDRKCLEPLKSIEVILIYENFGLNAVSFIKPSTGYYYDKDKVKEYGSISEWNKYLQQFPQIGNNNYSSIY
jgi:Leucine-rich repeat (LRR) protein